MATKLNLNVINLVECVARFFVSATIMYTIIESNTQIGIVMGLVMLILAIWIVLPALEDSKDK